MKFCLMTAIFIRKEILHLIRKWLTPQYPLTTETQMCLLLCTHCNLVSLIMPIVM